MIRHHKYLSLGSFFFVDFVCVSFFLYSSSLKYMHYAHLFSMGIFLTSTWFSLLYMFWSLWFAFARFFLFSLLCIRIILWKYCRNRFGGSSIDHVNSLSKWKLAYVSIIGIRPIGWTSFFYVYLFVHFIIWFGNVFSSRASLNTQHMLAFMIIVNFMGLISGFLFLFFHRIQYKRLNPLKNKQNITNDQSHKVHWMMEKYSENLIPKYGGSMIRFI